LTTARRVVVRLPGPLLPLSDGNSVVVLELAGATAGDALGALFARHPRLRDRIVDEQGRVRRHVNVFVDEESIRHTGGLDTPLPEGATVSVIPAVSGG
jgi:molybdopterin synthase sulfur carrier subunit